MFKGVQRKPMLLRDDACCYGAVDHALPRAIETAFLERPATLADDDEALGWPLRRLYQIAAAKRRVTAAKPLPVGCSSLAQSSL